MGNKPVHTVPDGDGWANEAGGRKISGHRKKAPAEKAGRRAAIERQTEHVVHNKDGRIGKKNSYGGDPHPPRG